MQPADLGAANFDDFAGQLLQPAVASRFSKEAGLAPDHARIYLAAIVNEAHLALRLLQWGGLSPGQRVLEVGAGAGLLTAYLQSRGVDLVAIEPIGSGFEATSVLREIVQDSVGIVPRILPIEARELDPGQHGSFDLIFSINVIEHFQPLNQNLDGLAHVLRPGGVQVHTCPNYWVPYEPHYGIALVPFAPRLTSRLWARRLRKQPLWRSLNFITSSDVRAYAARHGFELTFEKATLANSLQRMLDEDAFAERHPPALRSAAAIAKQTGLISVFRHLPPALVTPMTISLRRRR